MVATNSVTARLRTCDSRIGGAEDRELMRFYGVARDRGRREPASACQDVRNSSSVRAPTPSFERGAASVVTGTTVTAGSTMAPTAAQPVEPGAPVTTTTRPMPSPGSRSSARSGTTEGSMDASILRALAATTTEKSTVSDNSLNKVSTNGAAAAVPMACSIDDPDCEACQ